MVDSMQKVCQDDILSANRFGAFHGEVVLASFRNGAAVDISTNGSRQPSASIGYESFPTDNGEVARLGGVCDADRDPS